MAIVQTGLWRKVVIKLILELQYIVRVSVVFKAGAELG